MFPVLREAETGSLLFSSLVFLCEHEKDIMAWGSISVKCLLCKHQNLNLMPGIHVTKLGVEECTPHLQHSLERQTQVDPCNSGQLA